MTEIIVWAILFIVFVIIETVTAQIVSIWFALGALVSLIVSCFTDSILIQLIVFLAVSILSLLLTRPVFKKFINIKHEKTNTDNFVGKEGILIEEVDNIKGTGRLSISGLTWNARSIDDKIIIPVNSIVVIKEIKGVTAFVEKI